MRAIHGQCHCGNISFQFYRPGAQGDIAVRACGCSFCTKHGGVYTSHPDGELRAHVANPQAVNRYRFGTGTAEFHVCRDCGVVPFVTSRIEERDYAVVNANTFDSTARAQLQVAPSDFEGEDGTQRLARRRRTWIASVSITSGPR